MPPHVLLLGGHGNISLLMTPLLLQRSWTLTSMIRSSSQKSDVVSAAGADASNLSVKIADLEAINSQADAQVILDETRPDYVIFSAGRLSMIFPQPGPGFERSVAVTDWLSLPKGLAVNPPNPEPTPSIGTHAHTSSMPLPLHPPSQNF